MLRTKCIHAPISSEDGVRISVMSRHTLNDGVTPDPSIIEGVTYHDKKPELAPPPKMVGFWYRAIRAVGEKEVHEFIWPFWASTYALYLDKDGIRQEVEALADKALSSTVTILCVEETPEYCHRSILAAKAKALRRNLEVEHV